MPLPPVPSAVQKVANRHDLGKLEWIQPKVVQGSKMSARGYYFYSDGMVHATGVVRLKAKVYLWSQVADLNWDLYVNPLSTGAGVQQIRVWIIEFKDGSIHTIELPEAPSVEPLVVTDVSQVERRVWRDIVRGWQGKVAQNLEDTQVPITIGEDFIARYDGVTIQGNDYKWSNIASVWQSVTAASLGNKPESQETQVIVRTRTRMPRPHRPKLEALGIAPADAPPRFRDFVFGPDDLDLPLLFLLVREMPIHRKGFDDEA